MLMNQWSSQKFTTISRDRVDFDYNHRYKYKYMNTSPP